MTYTPTLDQVLDGLELRGYSFPKPRTDLVAILDLLAIAAEDSAVPAAQRRHALEAARRITGRQR